MRRAAAHVLGGLCVGALIASTVSTAGATPSAIDMAVNIGAAATNSRPALMPSGSTVTVTKRNFYVFLDVSLIAPVAAKGTVRVELGTGLVWGADGPDPTEQCVATTTTAECQTGDLQPIAGRSSAGWFWDVTAAQNGSYSFRAAMISSSDTDSNQADDTSSITIVVDQAAEGGGGGGGSASASASAVKLSPSKPKAGSAVVASVRVAKGGTPVRPTGVACSASIGRTKVRGSSKARSGVASCLFKSPKSAKGRTLRGSVSFRAGGTAFTRRFSTRLG